MPDAARRQQFTAVQRAADTHTAGRHAPSRCQIRGLVSRVQARKYAGALHNETEIGADVAAQPA